MATPVAGPSRLGWDGGQVEATGDQAHVKYPPAATPASHPGLPVAPWHTSQLARLDSSSPNTLLKSESANMNQSQQPGILDPTFSSPPTASAPLPATQPRAPPTAIPLNPDGSPPIPTSTPSPPSRRIKHNRRASATAHQPSPAKPPRRRIPLQRLLKAGTVVLAGCQVLDADAGHEAGAADVDGWFPLERGMLWQEMGQVVHVNQPVLPLPLSPVASYQPGKKRAKRPSAAASPTTKKRRLSLMPQPSQLDRLLALQDADVVRLTVWGAVEGGPATPPGEESEGVVVRVYLVPLDLAEHGAGEFSRGRKARPGASGVLSALALVRVNQDEWLSGRKGGTSTSLLDDDDHRSLLELYHDVHSPSTDPSVIDSLDAPDQVKQRLHRIARRVPHTSTQLFGYQLASVTKMLAKELAPQLVPDPAWQFQRDVDGAAYWLGFDGRVLLAPPLVREPRGGILAEEMGSGKTLISLALILASRGELPRLEGTSPFLDGAEGAEPDVMTYLSREWPFARARAERERGKRRVPDLLPGAESWMGEVELMAHWEAKRKEEEKDRAEADVERDLPSLKEICIDLVRTTSLAVPKLEGLGDDLEKELMETYPSYFLRPSPAQLDTRRGRAQDIAKKEIVVGATTLVVVPKGLCQQWAEAVEEHLEPGALKVLVLKHTTTECTCLDLAAHDVVIMSARVFADAAENADSPLRRVHFKRLMVDEGHVLGNDNATRTFAEQLRCEARWAISGTPTTSLRSAPDTDNSISGSGTAPGGSEKDLSRLGQLFSRFVRHPAFPKPEVWRSVFTSPMVEHGRGGGRLLRTLSSVVVKNQPDRIAEAWVLPPLEKETVFLTVDGPERLMYNCLLSLFCINAITSQRTDQDYLFHPTQQKYCDELTTNLSASAFFFANHEIAGRLADAITFARQSAAARKAAAWSAEDRASLDKALSVVQEALDDPDWNNVVFRQAVQIQVDGLESELVSEFGGLAREATTDRRADLIPVGGLVTLRGTVHQLRRDTAEGSPTWEDDEDLQEELITWQQQMRREDWKPPLMAPRRKGEVERLKAIDPDSAFRRIRLGTTSSAKLNWVVDEVSRHKNDKFIIFSSVLTDLAFATLSEAFDVLNIQHVVYAGSGHTRTNASGIRDRGQLISFFDHSPAAVCQCILVDAKLGGRGVGLTSANRVIFLEPIWQPDLLVQAEKRAHRLGQTRAVVQKTLCVRDSWEDEVRKQRAEMTRSEVEGRKAPQRDERLGAVLRAARWLEPPEERGKGRGKWRMFEIELQGAGAGRRPSASAAGGSPHRGRGPVQGPSGQAERPARHDLPARPAPPARSALKRSLDGTAVAGAPALPTPVASPPAVAFALAPATGQVGFGANLAMAGVAFEKP